jgi:hypothetical protein
MLERRMSFRIESVSPAPCSFLEFQNRRKDAGATETRESFIDNAVCGARSAMWRERGKGI